jgi:rubredoxin
VGEFSAIEAGEFSVVIMKRSQIEGERALGLTESCRKCGYIFDVESNADLILDAADASGFINKSDLIVLDYVLNAHTRSSAQALKIIRRLSNTPRFNLVVVYTTKAPMEIAPEIAVALRGKRKVQPSEKIIKSTGEPIDELLNTGLLDYLGGRQMDLAKWREELDAPEARIEDIKLLFEEHINNRFRDTETEQVDQLVACATTKGGRPWIRGKNVFVVVVQKRPGGIQTIDLLIDSLRDALKHHEPEPIAMLVQRSVNLLKESGEEILETAFGDRTTRAALLYHTLDAEHPADNDDDEGRLRLADLTYRALATLAYGIQDSLLQFGNRLLAGMLTENGSAEKRQLALRREKVTENVSDTDLLLCLNAFLCSQSHSIGYITSGTVFRNVEHPEEVWLCASPACDMVPRENVKIKGSEECYRKRIYPASHFEAIRLILVEDPKTIEKALRKATECKHVFLKDDEKRLQVYKALHGEENKPLTYVFYSATGGMLHKKRTKLTIPEKESCPKCGKPNFKLINREVEVIGQLRPEYANRLLTQKGGWNSRIGVDFISLKQ